MPKSEFVKAHLTHEEKQIETKFQVTVVEPCEDDWRGEFFTHHAIDRGEYQLVAEDGRVGSILVSHVYPDADGSCRCEFNGIDRFEKAK